MFVGGKAQCNDHDNDGVCDNVDLDDDNDGILDEEECPSTFVSQAFQTNGGTTTTFLAPGADGGFRFDIFQLDNSFNLNVNGVDVVPTEIQCQGSGATGESLLVFSSDKTGFGQSGNANIWTINGDVITPVVRLTIGPDGAVSFQGKRNSGSVLEPMEILGVDPQAANLMWNSAGNNTVILSQNVVGATNISGEGNGVLLCTEDLDGDGIVSSLDTDSDGDGCLDAVEGGAGFKLSDINNGMLSGVIDANGVPFAANGGQSKGSSQDATTTSVECAESLCGGDIDFNTWSEAGLDSQGDWIVAADGKSVNQTINGSPTFYNGNREFLNVKFSGKMRTDYANDDDYMGMVFGYQGDVLANNYPITVKTYVFGWKQKDQVVGGHNWPAGFSLVEVNKTITDNKSFYEAFAPPFTGSTVLAVDYGASKGYTAGVDYNVSIEYTSSNIKIYVDDNLIFDVDGCFTPGRVGFYNYSQPDVTYSDFKYQFISDIAVVDDTLCIGEELELDLTCNQAHFYPNGTIYNWDLKDGTKSNAEEVDHVYAVPGEYDVELIISDGQGCADTATSKIYVFANPIDNLGNDTTICDEKSFKLDAGISQNYLWSTAETTQTIDVTATGTYSVDVINDKGCTTNSSIDVTVNPCMIDHFDNDTLYICEGDSVKIEAKDVSTQVWGGDDGYMLVNDSTIKVSPSDDAYYYVGTAGGTTIGQNLIVNGDFESGNSGFTTEYQEKCTPTQGPGKFCINNNPRNVHGGFSACGDHTSGTGKMYIANGAPVAGQKVWCQTVTTEANKDYEFSAWVASVVGSNPPSFQFQVNGGSIGTLTANVGACQWDQYAATWNSGTTVSAEICLINQNTIGAGNDFAIDDISFAPVHQTASGGDSVLVIVHDKPIVDLGNDTTICADDQITFKTVLTGDYLWSTGSTQPLITVSQAGGYSLAVTNENGCTGNASIDLIVQSLPVVDLGNDTTICKGDVISISAINNGLTYLWNTGENTPTINIAGTGEYSVLVVDNIGCTSSDTMELFLQELPVVNLGEDTIICDKQEVKLNAQNTGLNYHWNTNESSQEIILKSSGVYGVEVTDDIGCLGSDSMKLTVNPMPVVDLGNDTAICIGESVGLNAQNLGFNYEWNTGETIQGITVNSTGIYNVRVYDAIGCSDTSSMKLQVNLLPVVKLGNDTVICEYQSVQLDAKNKKLNFIWNTGASTQTIEVDMEGSFNVEVRDSIGCLGKDDIYVTKEIIDDPYLEKDHLICEGTSVVLEPDFPKDYTINWEANPSNTSLEVIETGAYSSFVMSEHCKDTFIVNVTKIDTPDAVITDLRGGDKYCFDIESTTLMISSPAANDAFDWEDFGRSEEVLIEQAGDYNVTVTNTHCSSDYTYNVEEYCEGKFFIPNAFTPGDDNGVNEMFIPVSNGYVDGYDFRIYNRWGRLIFQTKVQGEGWDGNVNSNIVQTDVFIYRVSYNYASENGGVERKEQVGTVTLLK